MNLSDGTEVELFEYLRDILLKQGPVSKEDMKQLRLINKEFKRREREERKCLEAIQTNVDTSQ